MSTSSDLTQEIAGRVSAASQTGLPLEIIGNATKRFYGRTPRGEPLEVSGHCGITCHEPAELVLSARCGTPLTELTARLAEQGQMLAFEPPSFAGGATLGGVIATGLAGPRRAFTGSVRDMVLGMRIVNGRGQVLRFGGQVMKNVAGYDISRLMVGAMGTLGVVLEVSLKVLPLPETERTLVSEVPAERLYQVSEQGLRAGIPISAAAHDGTQMYLRLSGTASAVEAGTRLLGGQGMDGAERFWQDLRDHRLAFFTDPSTGPLWRIALPPAAPSPELDGSWLSDWAGRLIWLRSHALPGIVRMQAQRLGGHASLFRGGERCTEVFQPLDAPLLRLHQRLKAAFDPAGILNPGRLYSQL